MKIRMTLAVVIAAAFMTNVSAADRDSLETLRQSKARFPSATKSELKSENIRLKAEMDSLKIMLEQYKMELSAADSLNNEMMALFEGNKEENACGIAPEDYTAEISDSLLNIWYAHRMANDSEDIEEYNMDSIKFESNVPDSVYIRRLEKMNSFITLPYNEFIKMPEKE